MDEPRKPETDAEEVDQWEEAITADRKREEEWRKQAEQAIATFRGEDDSKSKYFNIFHSNVEIVAPSLFNSTPIPDVRRRFGDKDPVARTVSEIIERSLSYCADAYSFDKTQYRAVYDMIIPGRGATRVRYFPSSDGKKISAQKLTTELVAWDRLIIGNALVWEDVPYVAFEHFLDRDEVEKLNEDMRDVLPYNYSASGVDEQGDNRRDDKDETPKQFLRAKVWEIWNKKRQEVLFICPEYKDKIIKRLDDPLKLDGFIPMAAPMHSICTVDSMVPVCPYQVYRCLMEDLNAVSRRISRLVKQLRPRGAYAGNIPDIKALAEADDGELIALQTTDPNLSAGAIDVNKWVAWFPMEPTVMALRELIAQRDAIKVTIQEVMGIADIMRGQSDPRATAAAENLKAQFGSVRLRSMQAAVAVHVKDTFRIKAEIIAKHFEWPIISEMTNIKLLPKAEKQKLMQMAQANPEQAQQIAAQNPELAAMMQAPSVEEVMEILRSGAMAYKIDIETDSTIREDVRRNHEQMAAFLNGTAQFLGAIGPAVEKGVINPGDAMELYGAMARGFNLNKSAEDALERMANKPPQQQQDGTAGEVAKAKGAVEAAQVKAQADGQTKIAAEQIKAQTEREKIASNERIAQLEAQIKTQDQQLKQAEIQLKDARERQQHAEQINAQREDSARQAMLSRDQAMMQDDRERQSAMMQDARAGEAARMKDAQVRAQQRQRPAGR